jgi:hypothetical protein
MIEFFNEHKKNICIVAVIIIILFIVYVAGYWAGGREVTGSEGGNSSGRENGASTSKYMAEIRGEHDAAKQALGEAGRVTDSAEQSIRAAARTSEALDQSISESRARDIESEGITADCLSLGRENESIFKSTVYPDKTGKTDSKETKDTHGGLGSTGIHSGNGSGLQIGIK